RPRPLRLPIIGLPAIRKGTRWVTTPRGDRLVLAQGPTVDTYAVERQESQVSARLLAQTKLQNTVRDLLIARDGAVFVITECGDRETIILRVDGQPLRGGGAVPRRTAGGVTRRCLVLAVERSGLLPPQLVALNRKDGRILWQEPIRTSRVHLRAGRDNEVLIAE